MATKFITAVGRRKTAIATVRMSVAPASSVTVNGKSLKEYFKTDLRALIGEEALIKSGSSNNYKIAAHVEGGGIAAQAEALRHAISRAIVSVEPNTRKALKVTNFLKRDQRAKERKKPGLVKARKRKQWSKR